MLTGRDAVEGVLSESGVHVTRTDIADIHQRAPRFFEQLRRGEPNVVVINAENVGALDVMSLRWMFPAGVTPLVLCPSNPQECAELAAVAVQAARLIPGPVFLLLERPVADALAIVLPEEAPELMLPELPPQDAVTVDETESELLGLHARLAHAPKGLKSSVLEACPPDMGKPEWLVLSFGSAALAAQDAVAAARSEGQRVNLLRVRQLWPLPQADILRAAAGIKHIVVAERNLGQYAQEVRCLLPDLPIVVAGRAGTMTPELILERLRRTPRCC
jgi:pyruvate/2-oxoacid:ferredoxin oxidoreductase alpha subunit